MKPHCPRSARYIALRDHLALLAWLVVAMAVFVLAAIVRLP